MNCRSLRNLSTLALLLAGQATLTAQVTTGALSGRVTDPQGKPLPGVRVSLESPALFRPREYKTDANGEYRGQLLPVGTYSIKVSAEGWLGKSATNVRVGLGSTLSMDFTLSAVQQASAMVEIVASAEEAKTSDKVSVNYSAEELLRLPTDRSFDGALALAPGVTGNGLNTSIRGGSFGGQTKGGGGYSQVMYRIDGIDVKDDSGTQWDGPARAQLYEPLPDSIEDVQVVLSALNARNGRSQGGQVNVVTRSGSNTFEGSIRTTLSRNSWTTNLPHGPVPDSGNASFESNAVESYSRHTDITLSGPIIKDRLWFYVGTRLQPSQSGTATLGWNGEPVQYNAGQWDPIPGATLPSVMKYPLITWGAFPNVDNVLKGVGTPYPTGYGNFDLAKYSDWNKVVPADTTYHKYEGKLTGLVNQNNTLSLTYLYDKMEQGGRTGERTYPPNVAIDQAFVGTLTTETKAWTLGWNSTLSDRWFLEARAFKAEVTMGDVSGPTKYPIFVQSQLSTGDPNIQILSTDGQGLASGNGQAAYFGVFYNRRSSSDVSPNIRGNQAFTFNIKTFQEANGQHDIDFGAEIFQTKHQFGRERNGNRGVFEGGFIYNPDTKDFLYPTFYASSGVPLVPVDANGQPDPALVQFSELPMRGPGAHMERYWAGQAAARNKSNGFWVNDSWTLSPNWVLMVGLRYNQFNIRDTSEKELANINVTEPRLQLKWNPDGKGKEVYTFTAAKLASAYSDEMAAWFRTNGWTTRTVHSWKGLAGQPAVDSPEAATDPTAGVRWVDYNTLIDPNNYGPPSAIIDLSQTAKTDGLQVPYAIEWSFGYLRNFDLGSARINFVQRTYKKEWLSFIHDGYYDPANPTKYLTLVHDPSGSGLAEWQQTHRFLNSGLDQVYRGVEVAWNENITSRLNFGGNVTYSQITGRNSLDYYNYRDEKLRNHLSEDVFAPDGVLTRSTVLHAFLTYVYPVGKGNISASFFGTYATSGVRQPNGVGTLSVAAIDESDPAFGGHGVAPIDAISGQNITLNYNKYLSPMGAFTRGTDISTVDFKLQAQLPLAGKLMLTSYVQVRNIFNHIQKVSVYDWSGSPNGSPEFGTGGSVGSSVPINGRPLGGFSTPWGFAGDNTYYSGGRTFTEFSVGLKF
ncbi:MAG: carboxypeptidase regulatory-like domain-containing protein [Acidobacteria bacterium]|nr:carboxypeptidase regulatory-like domain-containing protein [Acidobacteriota bacterium]MBI3487566.1 carboxypeptidase regulatory-like domain-containing protein [Acidobacteriota bacterium]